MLQKVISFFRLSRIASPRFTRIFIGTIAVALVGLIGTYLLRASHASTPTASFEAEGGQTTTCATDVADATASDGHALKFGVGGCATSTSVGAQLPIQYDLASLSGVVRYVATNGSDSNNGTTTSTPYKTLAKAVSDTAAKTIVVRGGVYTDQRNVGISRSGLKIIAYPGETPEFKGSIVVSKTSGWTAEGSTLKYRAYIPRPIADGGGMPFGSETSMTNLQDAAGRYPDQVWVDSTALKQVATKAEVTNGKFWADRTNHRLYMTSTDISSGTTLETSRPGVLDVNGNIDNTDKDSALQIKATNITVEGIRFARYSPNASNYGVIRTETSGSGLTLKNVEIKYAPFSAISINYLNNATLQNVTVTDASWIAITANYADNLNITASKIDRTDPFDEFTGSPGSGGIKATHTWNSSVTNSEITNSNSHAIWFDQSNYKIVIANNKILNSTGNAVFFEISDDLNLVNNYIQQAAGGKAGLKLAGSSELTLVNNTIVGGADGIGIYTDNRSLPNCSKLSSNCSAWFASSDPYDLSDKPQNPDGTTRTLPATMDWMPRVDLILNNIIAYPAGAGLCGNVTSACITLTNSTATVTVQSIFHKANTPYSGLPQSRVDGNIYTTSHSGGRLYVIGGTSYTTLGAFSSAMAASPVSISGFEATGSANSSLVGTDGVGTGALTHTNAAAVPTDSVINTYVPAGTKHYGVTYK